MSTGERQAGRQGGGGGGGCLAGDGGCGGVRGGGRLFLSRAEINHGTEAIMCNSTPARLVTLVT